MVTRQVFCPGFRAISLARTSKRGDGVYGHQEVDQLLRKSREPLDSLPFPETFLWTYVLALFPGSEKQKLLGLRPKRQAKDAPDVVLLQLHGSSGGLRVGFDAFLFESRAAVGAQPHQSLCFLEGPCSGWPNQVLWWLRVVCF